MKRFPILVLILLALSGCAPAFAVPSISFGTPSAGQVRASMAAYRQAHPVCEACGKSGSIVRRLEVHHIHPQNAFPSQAADQDNFIMLCRPCHLYLAHVGDFGKYVDNLRAVMNLRIIKENKP